MVDIEPKTGLIYFGTEDSYVSKDITSLDTKFSGLIQSYKRAAKNVGEVVRTELRGEVLYGLIVKNTNDDKMRFTDLENCCKKLSTLNKKDGYYYFGIDAPFKEGGSMHMEKIINVMRSILYDNDIYICWPEDRRNFMPTVVY